MARDQQRGTSGPRVFIAAVVLLVVAGFAAIRLNGAGPARDVSTTRNEPAPEFQKISAWLNTKPLSVQGLRGKVVLIDFWTFSCINCLRTFPGLHELYDRYKPTGLEIVGVHSPEFSFEKVTSNVRDAVQRLDVTWPVGMDNDMATWRAYKNNYWPHVYLIDRTGVIRYDKIGEGDEGQLEEHLRDLLAEGGHTLPRPVAIAEPNLTENMTPEIYAGYERGEDLGSIANSEGYVKDREHTYRAPSAAILSRAATDGAFFLDGSWTGREERLEAQGSVHILLPFRARDVYIVASAQPSQRVRVLVDGRSSDPGADVKDGVITIGGSRLYTLVHLPQAGRHMLTLEAGSGLSIYSFTFG